MHALNIFGRFFKRSAVRRSNPGAFFFENLFSTFMSAGVIVGISSSTAKSVMVVFEEQLVSSIEKILQTFFDDIVAVNKTAE